MAPARATRVYAGLSRRRTGRNVAHGFRCERLNLEAAQFVGDNPTDKELEEMPDVLTQRQDHTQCTPTPCTFP